QRIEDRLGLDRGSVNGQMIFEKVEEDDQVYIEELDYMIDKLAVGISTMAYIYNPGTIILGGGIMARSDYFEPRLSSALKKYLNPMILEKTNIVFASLKNDAGMVGALKNFLNRSI
ncbi:MAG: ROK family protein, partial [Peptostreptococcus sp.]|nr:ROK family protein [Peptostreptococcus sp.]